MRKLGRGSPSPRDRVRDMFSFGYPDRGHLVNSYRTSRATLAETVTWVE